MKILRHPLTEMLAIAVAVAGLFLFALPVKAADPYPGAYWPIRTQHGTHSAAAIAVTNATDTNVDVVSLTCAAACYYAFFVSNASTAALSSIATTGIVNATNTTTQFLPSNVPVTHSIQSGTHIVIIAVSTGGTFHFTE